MGIGNRLIHKNALDFIALSHEIELGKAAKELLADVTFNVLSSWSAAAGDSEEARSSSGTPRSLETPSRRHVLESSPFAFLTRSMPIAPR